MDSFAFINTYIINNYLFFMQFGLSSVLAVLEVMFLLLTMYQCFGLSSVLAVLEAMFCC